MLGLIAEKLGMTQIYGEDGSQVPVTVVRVPKNVVVGIKTKEKNGYNAVELGCGEQKEHRLTKADLGQFKKAKIKPCRHLKEFRTDKASEFKIGQTVDVSQLAAGQIIDVQGTSKGRGFQGVIRMYHFRGGCDSHGNSVSHRRPGATGQRTSPGRVIPGKKLPRHMGDETKTVKNLPIMAVENEQDIVLIRGAIPGAKSAKIYLYPAAEFETKVLSSSTGSAT